LETYLQSNFHTALKQHCEACRFTFVPAAIPKGRNMVISFSFEKPDNVMLSGTKHPHFALRDPSVVAQGATTEG
jgi:hypothetical protein